MDVTVPNSVATDHDDRVADCTPTLLEGIDLLIGEIHEVHDFVALIGHIDFACTADFGAARSLRRHVERCCDRTTGAVVFFRFGKRLAIDHVERRIEQQ